MALIVSACQDYFLNHRTALLQLLSPFLLHAISSHLADVFPWMSTVSFYFHCFLAPLLPPSWHHCITSAVACWHSWAISALSGQLLITNYAAASRYHALPPWLLLYASSTIRLTFYSCWSHWHINHTLKSPLKICTNPLGHYSFHFLRESLLQDPNENCSS